MEYLQIPLTLLASALCIEILTGGKTIISIFGKQPETTITKNEERQFVEEQIDAIKYQLFEDYELESENKVVERRIALNETILDAYLEHYKKL